MNKLAIFDVDGTLIDSMGIDSICYVQSIKDIFNVKYLNEDWSTYKNSTDKSIFTEIYENQFNKKPTVKEIDSHVKRFVELLKMNANKESIKQIPGSNQIFETLINNKWNIGIATGCWRESVKFKLQIAGVDIKDYPLVTSTEMEIRSKIVSECVNQSKSKYMVEKYDKIVIIGDAIWDVKVAKESRYGFVGINNENNLSKYTQYVIDNYLDKEKFVNYIEDANVPY